MYPKEALNRIKWTGNPLLEGVRVWYIHRGAPGDMKVVDGTRILRLEHSFFVVLSHGRETHIPYHRILRIEFNGECVFKRQKEK